MSSEICSTFFSESWIGVVFPFSDSTFYLTVFFYQDPNLTPVFPFPYLVLPTSVTADKSIALYRYDDMPLFKVNLLFGVSFMTILAKYEIKYVKCWHHPVN